MQLLWRLSEARNAATQRLAVPAWISDMLGRPKKRGAFPMRPVT
jgi:hypothetical protein